MTWLEQRTQTAAAVSGTEYWISIQSFAMLPTMDETPSDLWIAACAHRLQQRWRTVDPLELEEVAAELWRDERLRAMAPGDAAVAWLGPVTPLPF